MVNNGLAKKDCIGHIVLTEGDILKTAPQMSKEKYIQSTIAIEGFLKSDAFETKPRPY